MDHARGVQRQLEGDDAAVGVPHDMRPFHAQVAQQSPAVSGLPGDADRLRRRGCCPHSRGGGRG